MSGSGRARRGGRGIFAKYLATVVSLSGLSLVILGAVSIYFVQRENDANIERLQRARAAGARESVVTVLRDLRVQVVAATSFPGADPPSLRQRERRYAAFLAQVSPISELAFLDGRDREQLRVRKDGPSTFGSATDRSAAPEVARASVVGFAVGHVYSRTPGGALAGPAHDGTASGVPHVTVAAVEPAGFGVTLAEASIEPLRERLQLLQQADPRFRYLVVDERGELVAHSDPSVDVARDATTALPQVRRALQAPISGDGIIGVQRGKGVDGGDVLTSWAGIPDAGWRVIVEESRPAALAPVREAVWRTVLLVAGLLVIAAGASALAARRMIRPIRLIGAGTERIGAGDLDHRIEVRTEDELQDLAEDFNRMRDRLRESYADLEQRVEDRTRELSSSLEENARLLDALAQRTAELEAANSHRSAFLRNMSHELRTPLNAIIGFSEVMREGLAGGVTERQAAYLSDIHDSGRHLQALINDVLDLSKVEAGRMELEVEPVDVVGTTEQAMAMVRERAAAGGVSLSVQADDAVSIIQADTRKVRQIVLNLLSNAVKFTPAGGSVEVLIRPQEDGVELAVRDSGPGLRPEDVEVIFEEFSQVGPPDGRREGMGLGLPLARRFAELHGGSLGVESALGAGCTFVLRLPSRAAAQPTVRS